MALDLAMVAGEASGDLLASLLLRGLKPGFPGLKAHGIGGDRMREEGFLCDWHSEALAVRGYAEVLVHLPRLLLMRRRLGDMLLMERPDAFVGVDAPDFNLDLEMRLKRHGVPVLHFVSPSIWAWRGERIDKIRRAVDHMLVLFPFEAAIYAEAGISASYVGHPLADEIALIADRHGARAALGLDQEASVVALMPGSRLAEIDYNGPAFLGAAAELARERAGLRLVAPMASAGAARRFLGQIKRLGLEHLEINVLGPVSHQVLAAADAVLVASGTATLEAALFKRPMVIAYRMAPLSYAMMKDKGYLPWVGLPNILAREFLVPELLQDQATPAALAQALRFQLDDESNKDVLSRRFMQMHLELRCDTATRSAAAIGAFLDSRRVH